jgi:hypothetical protein
MALKHNQALWRCEICNRPMNSADDLTDMRKPGVFEPLRICAAKGCWDEAAARGYKSRYQA